MARTSTTARCLVAGVGATLLALSAMSCSGSAAGPVAPGTSAVVGGSDGSAPTSTSVPSNSEAGIPGNPGSVAEQRPPTAGQ